MFKILGGLLTFRFRARHIIVEPIIIEPMKKMIMMAVAALVGIILNAVLPGNDFHFTSDYASGKRAEAEGKDLPEDFKKPLHDDPKYNG